MLVRERLHRFANRAWHTRAGIMIADSGLFVPKYMNVLAVLGRDGGREKILIAAHNLITDAGDVWYAQKAAAETVTNDFNRHAMASARTSAWAKSGAASQYGNVTVIAGSSQANDGTYPRTADPDADNTGDGTDIMTHRVSYAAAAFSGTIVAGIFHASAQTVSGSPLLTGYDFTSFTKAITDTLKVFVNHNFTGA